MTEHKTWPKVVEELLALHETFRRLGFPAEELFVHMYSTGQVQFVLSHKDQKFTIDVGVGLQGQDLIVAEKWSDAVTWWNKEATKGELDAIYAFSAVAGRRESLLRALHTRNLL